MPHPAILQDEAMKPIQIPIEDSLDLHTFQPGEVPELIDGYLKACVEKGIWNVRIIHGKGKGFLRNRVQGLLEKNTLVVSYKTAPPEAGGWGATLVRLKADPPE